MAKFSGKLTFYILVAAVATVVMAWFYPHAEASHYKYEEGRPWNYAQLIAPFDVPIRPDSATILAAVDSLDTAFAPAFRQTSNVADSVLAQMRAVISANSQDGESTTSEAYFSALAPHIRAIYSGNVIDDEHGKRIAAGELPNVRIVNGNTLSVKSTADFTWPARIVDAIDSAYAGKGYARLNRFYDLHSHLRPNIVFDVERSSQLHDYEISRITAVRGVIQQGQTIIGKGDIITPQDYVNLQTYEQLLEQQLAMSDRSGLLMLLGQLSYIGLLLASLLLFLRYFVPEVWRSKAAILFIFSSIVIFFMVAVGLEHFMATGVYITPFAIVPILVLVFFDARTALCVSTVLTLLCAPVTTFPLEFIAIQFAAASAAVYSLRELSNRSQLLRTAAVVGAVSIATYTALELMLNGAFDGFSWRMVAYLAINAALTSMAYILMFAVERIFGFISVVTLVELADINSPLLRRLSDECPGTFQHSVSVSTLAADAVARIGGNTQLVRAGALYHDIGKLANPAFFTENQHGVNPHDALPPLRSAEIIVSHVTDGLRQADKAGLPAVIKDFIRQHHGAGKAKYFYFTYCKQHPDEQVDPAPFTYPGPNPQTREASVLMMADSVEAASRSLTEHTRQAISDLVNKIIDSQIAEGLHNESPLSFRDVTIIKDMFIRRLMTIYHSRITYPDAPKKV